jgi:hypothetical protein
MTLPRVLLVLVGFLIGLTGTKALADPALCMEPRALATSLSAEFGEFPVATATSSTGLPLETWANPETGTWTLVVATSLTESCIVAFGTDWQEAGVGA